jgi:hypothetical protein
MRIKSLKVSRFRSFAETQHLALGAVNIFIGHNNAGKSSLLRAAYLMQEGHPYAGPDVRLDSNDSLVELELEGIFDATAWGAAADVGQGLLRIALGTNPEHTSQSISLQLTGADGANYGLPQFPGREPLHAVVPYFSRRKTAGYQEDVREEHALRVGPSFDYLAARLSRLGNFAFPPGQQYREMCEAILGFVVTAVPSPNG